MQATFKRKKKIDHVRTERTDDIPAIHRLADVTTPIVFIALDFWAGIRKAKKI